MFWSPATRQHFALRLELRDPVLPQALDELRRRITAFANLGARGGFVDQTEHPADARLQLVAADLTQPDAPAFELTAEYLDVLSLHVLRNLVEAYSGRVQGVASLDVRTIVPAAPAAPMLIPAITEDNAHELYPEPSGSGTIDAEFDEPQDYQKSRRCLVELTRRAPREKLDALLQCVGDWVTVVELGGYSSPVRLPHEAEAWVDTLQVYDDYSVELVFSLFEAADTAWASLLNVLARFSAEIEPIALVGIE